MEIWKRDVYGLQYIYMRLNLKITTSMGVFRYGMKNITHEKRKTKEEESIPGLRAFSSSNAASCCMVLDPNANQPTQARTGSCLDQHPLFVFENSVSSFL